ncbi:MAG: FGGY family carbohydrate kinase [Saprospiraceae bacterium]|nr:FGGY family carbohydrate kinase [Saprospiraceae bacterium]
MYLLGIDLGSSFIKVAVMDAQSQMPLITVSVPEQEMNMDAHEVGWAEQDPELWWDYVKRAIQQAIQKSEIDSRNIVAIGISYQMHGLILTDREGKTLRPAIIWCDSRAVGIGDKAFRQLGEDYCLRHLLNSPGNFTASKLSWVIQQEPGIVSKIEHFLLPGDFINFKLTGTINTTVPALSEGMFWDFSQNTLALPVLNHYQIQSIWCPKIVDTFAIQGEVKADIAAELGLNAGVPVCYRAGDQPNNAFSLNVMRPGEIAATAGTSGVVYGIQNQLHTDKQSRINAFAHVNHTLQDPRIGILLCINGTGISNSWLKKAWGNSYNYSQLNELAASVPIGADQLMFFPFGNGAERMLGNRLVHSHLMNLNFNKHQLPHLSRAVQEGIAFSFRYGMEIMIQNGMSPSKIKAGKANLFLSPLFRQLFTTSLNTPLEFYDTDGATGAARGAGIGLGLYTHENAFDHLKKMEEIYPDKQIETNLNDNYQKWKNQLDLILTPLL